jgi:choline dehydrogenase-like flavoprotein
VAGYYEEGQRGWWGPPQAGLTDRFADIEDGHGFLIESGPVNPGIGAASTPWETGRQHKEFMSEARFAAAFVFLIRDRGHGRVTIDRDGNAVHEYPLTDPLDVRIFRRGLTELARLHEAAGARRIITYQRRLTQWDRGEDLDAFIERLDACPLSPYEHAIFSAHQMGSCRMGKDRASSVAGPWGELHDTPGVWIGDASAFPSASGVNPMVSVMALAHRTAEAILAAD